MKKKKKSETDRVSGESAFFLFCPTFCLYIGNHVSACDALHLFILGEKRFYFTFWTWLERERSEGRAREKKRERGGGRLHTLHQKRCSSNCTPQHDNTLIAHCKNNNKRERWYRDRKKKYNENVLFSVIHRREE